MFFKINPSNGTPVYEQVVNQIVSAIAVGSLESGEMIPSVRQLSIRLAINPNTVARAYRMLQDSGLVKSIRGSGLQIVQGAQKKCVAERRKTVRNQIKDTVSQAIQSQMSSDEIRSIFEEILSSQGKRK